MHVCRAWRNVVFGSPRRLGLRLYCDHYTPVKRMLDVWPQFPIVMETDGAAGDIIAALEHSDHIYHLDLRGFPRSQLKETFEAMQRPFPVLKYLRIVPKCGMAPIAPAPASFLGGFAPRLQTLDLTCIPFPGLPKLLLSATNLVTLSLGEILPSGYISPEALVNCLSALTRLDELTLEYSYCFPNWTTHAHLRGHELCFPFSLS